jgi:dTDP-4-amino-4,6-dideoxygalactose transaminase
MQTSSSLDQKIEAVNNQQVPFFRPDIREQEVGEVIATLRSGWITSGERVKRFERDFARSVAAPHAIALNSATAAMHLAVDALGLGPGQAVLVPTMTFAATAEVVRYQGAIPILVDCDRQTLNIDLADASGKMTHLSSLTPQIPKGLKVVGIMPVHVGGMMVNMKAVRDFAELHGLWIVEDAAHAFPAAWRSAPDESWQRCGSATADVTCFSFYANKTITTGEGGMAVTADEKLADRMRLMSLHGLSHDAWGRYTGGGSWDYKIMAPGFKYNLTDIAAAIGIHQLARAEEMRREREAIAALYAEAFSDIAAIELPAVCVNRIHSWHLFPIRLRLDLLKIDRNQFIEELKRAGVGCSVHWRPLHLHPYYEETFGWRAEDFPVATSEWQRVISLPIFPGMRTDEIDHVVETVRTLCGVHG